MIDDKKASKLLATGRLARLDEAAKVASTAYSEAAPLAHLVEREKEEWMENEENRYYAQEAKAISQYAQLERDRLKREHDEEKLRIGKETCDLFEFQLAHPPVGRCTCPERIGRGVKKFMIVVRPLDQATVVNEESVEVFRGQLIKYLEQDGGVPPVITGNVEVELIDLSDLVSTKPSV
jgi:hypothetical protein